MELEINQRTDGFYECTFVLRETRYWLLELDADDLLALSNIEDENLRAKVALAKSLRDVDDNPLFADLDLGVETIGRWPGGVFNGLASAFAELSKAESGN